MAHPDDHLPRGHATLRECDPRRGRRLERERRGRPLRARPEARRQLHIVYGKNLEPGASGQATIGYTPPDVVVRRTIAGVPLSGYPVACGARLPGPSGKLARVRCDRGAHIWLLRPARRAARDPSMRLSMRKTVVHELGHVLGLRHERSRCAVMAADGVGSCPAPPQPWQLRCRLLERDDVRGAIARYGGTRAPLASQFCDGYPAAGPPKDLAAAFDAAAGSVQVSWTNARSSTLQAVRFAMQRDACLTEPPEASHPVAPGARDSTGIDAPDDGRFCISIWSEDRFGRLSAPATTWIDVVRAAAPEVVGRSGRGG